MNVKESIRRLIIGRVRNGLLRLDAEHLHDWIRELLTDWVREVQPRDAVVMLLNAENTVAALLTEQAIRFGDGTHPKHRLTGYHDFFVNRVSPSERVLDVGCGFGAVARDLAERVGANVVGVDLSAANIERAKRECVHPRVEYVEGDATLSVPKGRFDVVVMSNVLEHIHDRVGLLRRLREQTGCKRFLLRVPLYERDWHVPLRRELGLDFRLDLTHQTEYTGESFAEEIKEAGMTIIHQEVRWEEIRAECATQGVGCKAEGTIHDV